MTEELKDIKDYEGLYAITRDGDVWSYKSNKFLKHKLARGYHQVILCKEGKGKTYYIHRLVAKVFIPNPDNLPQVNHKDEDKSNNCVENLEWCDVKYNINYGTRTKRAAKKQSIPVYCEELNRTFNSQVEAAKELGLNRCNIVSCCKGKRKTTGGYHWRYAETSVEEV